MNDGRETVFRKGDKILRGKMKYSSRTGRGRPHRHGDQNPANMSRPCGRSRGKRERVSLVRAPLWLPVAFAGPEP